jgi:plasmid stabilization system protein ParE
MTGDQGFALHPAAAQDITEIWQFIANDNPAAAGNFREEILQAIRNLVKFPTAVTFAQISPPGHYAFKLSAIT